MSKKQKQTTRVYQAERLGLHYYLSLVAAMITGPAILFAYVFTVVFRRQHRWISS